METKLNFLTFAAFFIAASVFYNGYNNSLLLVSSILIFMIILLVFKNKDYKTSYLESVFSILSLNFIIYKLFSDFFHLELTITIFFLFLFFYSFTLEKRFIIKRNILKVSLCVYILFFFMFIICFFCIRSNVYTINFINTTNSISNIQKNFILTILLISNIPFFLRYFYLFLIDISTKKTSADEDKEHMKRDN